MLNTSTLLGVAAIAATFLAAFLLMSGIGWRDSLKILLGYILGGTAVYAFLFFAFLV